MLLRRACRVIGLGLSLLCWILPGLSAAAEPTVLKILADSFPPLQYELPGGAPAGYVHAFVQEVVQRAGRSHTLSAQPLQFLPLKRALAQAQTEPNVLLLSVARTPERAEAYRWLREIAPYQLWLYRLRTTGAPPVRTLAELKGRGLRFGVQDQSNFQEWLRAQGVGQPPDNSVIDPVRMNALNLRKAQLQRIDFFAHPDVSFAYRVHEAGLRTEDFEPVLQIQALSAPLWLLISKNSEPALVSALQQALDTLIAAGRLEALRSAELAQFSGR